MVGGLALEQNRPLGELGLWHHQSPPKSIFLSNVVTRYMGAFFVNNVATRCCPVPLSFFRLLEPERACSTHMTKSVCGVEDGQRDTAAVRPLLINQLPPQGMCFFAPDAVSWARPCSRVWKDVPYVHHAVSDLDAGLAWGAEAHMSGSLPVDVQRMPGKPTAQDVGGAHMQALTTA
jgi:hypothetical protein